MPQSPIINPVQIDSLASVPRQPEASLSDSRFCLEKTCPIQYVLDLIGNKWAVLVLRELFRGDRRTHELLTALPGISTKTLMVRLHAMEDHGLITRRVYAEVPPHVEYSLTSKGRELQPVLALLHQVGTSWMEQDHPCSCPLETGESKD